MNSLCRYGCVYLYVWFRLGRWWSRPHRKFLGHVDDHHRWYRRRCPHRITHSIDNYITDLLSGQNMERLIQSEEQKTHQKWPKDSIVRTKWVSLPFEIIFNVDSLLDCCNHSIPTVVPTVDQLLFYGVFMDGTWFLLCYLRIRPPPSCYLSSHLGYNLVCVDRHPVWKRPVITNIRWLVCSWRGFWLCEVLGLFLFVPYLTPSRLTSLCKSMLTLPQSFRSNLFAGARRTSWSTFQDPIIAQEHTDHLSNNRRYQIGLVDCCLVQLNSE